MLNWVHIGMTVGIAARLRVEDASALSHVPWRGEMMSKLLKNAVASIRMGIEDYRSQDADRDVSAVRNYYAGVLLLAKEVLVRQFPAEDPAVLLAAKIRLTAKDGALAPEPEGKATVDFDAIGSRLKDFGIVLDVRRLETLRRIRNDLEHRYSDESKDGMRRAIAAGFPVIAELFRILGEIPAIHLEAAWTTMLETSELYEAELARARQSIQRVQWHSKTFARAELQCPHCDSGLVVQENPENVEQASVHLACEACGKLIVYLPEFIESVLEEELGADGHIRAMEGGDGPLYDCPSCDRHCFIDSEWICASCGFRPRDGTERCAVCWEPIALSELLQDPQPTLCGYHRYVAEKED